MTFVSQLILKSPVYQYMIDIRHQTGNRCTLFTRDYYYTPPREVAQIKVKVVVYLIILKEVLKYNITVVRQLIPSLSINDGYHTFVFHHSIISRRTIVEAAIVLQFSM